MSNLCSRCSSKAIFSSCSCMNLNSVRGLESLCAHSTWMMSFLYSLLRLFLLIVTRALVPPLPRTSLPMMPNHLKLKYAMQHPKAFLTLLIEITFHPWPQSITFNIFLPRFRITVMSSKTLVTRTENSPQDGGKSETLPTHTEVKTSDFLKHQESQIW